jgi:uncharacterized protein (DUF2141 family)
MLGMAALAAALPAAPALAGEVVVTVTDLRSVKGTVRACMTTRADVFPKCNDVKPGNYAWALLHDENKNGKADRSMGMMPKEGYGFSRDAPVKMAPPKFKDAVFTQGDGNTRLTVKMRYFL